MPEARASTSPQDLAPQDLVLRDLALSLDRPPRAVADTCLRYRYEESPDLLAYMASRGELDYAGVLALARDLLSGDTTAEDVASSGRARR